MKRHLVWHLILALVVALALAGRAWAEGASSWIFRPAEYSHDPQSHVRVAQYAPPVAPIFHGDPNYQQSAYRYNESSIRVGLSADHLHIVETWGNGEYIRPYGEWLFPYRPGATPYSTWGNPGPLPWGPWGNSYPYGLGQQPLLPWGQGLSFPSAPLMPPVAAPYPMPAPAPNAAPNAGPMSGPTTF